MWRAVLPGLALLWLFGPTAQASFTDPPLQLTAATATASPAGVLVHIEGTFPSADLVQGDYPLTVFVRELTTGTDVAVRSPDSRFLYLGRDRIEVLLPADFPRGPAEVSLIVDYEGEPVFSNGLPISIEDTRAGVTP